jgi:hypothetical protein
MQGKDSCDPALQQMGKIVPPPDVNKLVAKGHSECVRGLSESLRHQDRGAQASYREGHGGIWGRAELHGPVDVKLIGEALQVPLEGGGRNGLQGPARTLDR